MLESLKSKMQIIPIAGEDMEQQEFHSLFVEMQKGKAILEDSLAASCEAKYSLTTQSSNSCLRYLLNWLENLSIRKNLGVSVCSSFIHEF